MDIGRAIKLPFDDPEWWKKCLIAGLITLIPVVGVIVVLGWQRRIFENARSGNPSPLPDIAFGDDLGRGVAPFVAVLNIAAIAVVLAIGVAVAVPVAGAISDTLAGIVAIFANLVMVVVMLAASVLVPDFLRRGFEDGEMLPLLKPGPTISRITGDVGAYVMLLVGFFVANFIGGLGSVACGIGALFTAPLGYVMMTYMLADYASTDQ